jgi:hypothetical protein
MMTSLILVAALQASPSTPRVGQWVQYRLSGGEGRVSYWRIAVVGQERDPHGRNAFWLELEWGDHPSLASPLVAVRALIALPDASARAVTRAWVSFAGEPARELPPETLFTGRVAELAALRPVTPAPGPAVRSLPQRLVTPAGPLDATRSEIRAGRDTVYRVWHARDVPILGLARVELPGLSHRMELFARGESARCRMALPPPSTANIPSESHSETAGAVP